MNHSSDSSGESSPDAVTIKIDAKAIETYRQDYQQSELVDQAIAGGDPRLFIGLADALRRTEGIKSLKINSVLRAGPGGGRTHNAGRGLDISRINGEWVNNGGYNKEFLPKTAESDLHKRFRENLDKTKIFSQIFTPWKVRYSANNEFTDNRYYPPGAKSKLSASRNTNNYIHHHHIHIGVKRWVGK